MVTRAAVRGLLTLACVGAVLMALYPRPVVTQTAQLPSFSHVFLIVMENHESSRVLGNTSAPYINRLAGQNSLATQYYAVSHPSLPNYLALLVGDTFGLNDDCTNCFFNRTSLPDQIEASGRTWRAYQENMPSACFLGDSGTYAQRHNPFIYLDPIRLNPERCASSIVPFDRLATDLEQGQVPNLVFVTPDVCNDGHDCPLEVGDNWLRQVVPNITTSPAYLDGGLLVITWDEGNTADGCCGGLAQGGHVVTILASPVARTGFTSDVPETHYHLLRTIEDAWGLTPLGHAADVAPMSEYFVPS
jgi:hypothetical protein